MAPFIVLVTSFGLLRLAGLAGIGALDEANVHAARAKLTLGGRPVTPLPLRSVLQAVFFAAVIGAGMA